MHQHLFQFLTVKLNFIFSSLYCKTHAVKFLCFSNETANLHFMSSSALVFLFDANQIVKYQKVDENNTKLLFSKRHKRF